MFYDNEHSMGNQNSSHENQCLMEPTENADSNMPVIYGPKDMTDKQIQDKLSYWFQKVCQTIESQDNIWKNHLENLRESSQRVNRKTYTYRIQHPTLIFCSPQVDMLHPSVKKIVSHRGICGPMFQKKISLSGPNFTHTTITLDWNDIYGIEILLHVNII